MALDEPSEKDITKKYKNLSFIYDEELKKILEDVEIDYDESVWGSGFTIKTSIGFISRLQILDIPELSNAGFSSGLC